MFWHTSCNRTGIKSRLTLRIDRRLRMLRIFSAATFVATFCIHSLALGFQVSQFSSKNIYLRGYCSENIDVSFNADMPTSPGNFYMGLAAANLSYQKNKLIKENQLERWGFKKVHHLGKDKKGYRAYVAEHRKFVLISVRGTKSNQDYLTNAMFFQSNFDEYSRIEGTRVHAGMKDAYEKLRAPLYELLSEITDQSKPIFLTGHSLGGALGILLTYELYLDGYNIRAMNAYAQPKVGNDKLQKQIDRTVGHLIFGLAAEDDITPMVPPQAESAKNFSEIITEKQPALRKLIKNTVLHLNYNKSPGKLFVMHNEGPALIKITEDKNPIRRELAYWKRVSTELADRSDLKRLFDFVATRFTSHPTQKYLCQVASYVVPH